MKNRLYVFYVIKEKVVTVNLRRNENRNTRLSARVDLLKESIDEIGKPLTIDGCKTICKKLMIGNNYYG